MGVSNPFDRRPAFHDTWGIRSGWPQGKGASLKRLILTPDTIGPIQHGHPWVYENGVRGRAEAGDLVELADDRGNLVAFGLADDGPIAVRVLGREPMPITRLLEARLRQAQAHRLAVVPPETNAYRLVNGEGDCLPGLVVDRYDSLAIVRLYSAGWIRHLGVIVDALASLGWPEMIGRRLGVERVDGGEGLVQLRGPRIPEQVVVSEYGLRFLVRPSKGQKTGLFLDQRENRRLVGGMAAGARVVNLFGYTGGFSVHAAAHGARRTVTVDISADALADARENFRLNDLHPERHGFEATDAFRWRGSEPAEIVICDPPSLSRSARSDPDARNAYRDLNRHAASLTAPGGILVTSSCTARIVESQWEEAVRKGLQRTDGSWSVILRTSEPPDHPVGLGHPEGRYLKFLALRHFPARVESPAPESLDRAKLAPEGR